MDVAAAKPVDPRRYFENVRADSDMPAREPVCLYLRPPTAAIFSARPVRAPTRSSSRLPT